MDEVKAKALVAYEFAKENWLPILIGILIGAFLI